MKASPQGETFRPAPVQEPLGPDSEVHDVFCNMDLASTSGGRGFLTLNQFFMRVSADSLNTSYGPTIHFVLLG